MIAKEELLRYLFDKQQKINKKLEEDSNCFELGEQYKNYKTDIAFEKAIKERDMLIEIFNIVREYK
jgi:hypothetical protein